MTAYLLDTTVVIAILEPALLSDLADKLQV